MLVIRTIKLSFHSQPRIKINKKVRVGYDQYICHNKKPGRILTTHPSSSSLARHTSKYQISTIQWKQDMTLPIIYKKQLQFQFYPVHEFGYNPDEINQVCYAKVMIQNYRKCCGQGKVLGNDGGEVGRVYFQFNVINQKKSKSRGQGQNQVEIQTRISVSSMLAHFDSYHGEKGHFQIWIDGQNTITPQIRFIAGQLLWAETLTLPVFTNLPEHATLSFHIFIDNNLIGICQFPTKTLRTNKQRYKKQPILHVNSNQKCGILFIDLFYKQFNKKQDRSSTSRLENLDINNSSSRNGHYSAAYLPMLGNKSHRQNTLSTKYENKSIKSTNSQHRISKLQLRQQINTQKSQPYIKPNPELASILQNKLRKRDNSQTILSKYLKYYK